MRTLALAVIGGAAGTFVGAKFGGDIMAKLGASCGRAADLLPGAGADAGKTACAAVVIGLPASLGAWAAIRFFG